jgi:hypothetical protein
MGTGILSPGVKRPGGEDYSPPSRAEAKNERDYTTTRNLKGVGAPLLGTLEDVKRKATGTGISLHSPLRNLEGGSYTGDFER